MELNYAFGLKIFLTDIFRVRTSALHLRSLSNHYHESENNGYYDTLRSSVSSCPIYVACLMVTEVRNKLNTC